MTERKEGIFFFEKKKQKTFIRLERGGPTAVR
jgi:hypothetical protein